MSLNPKKTSQTLTISREKAGKSFSLKRDNSKVPLYITTLIQDKPKDFTSLASYATGGMVVTRTFERIDESRGVDDR